MTALVSRSQTVVGEAGQQLFTVPFPYISRTHVVVKVNFTVLYDHQYTWLTDSSIQLDNAADSGDLVLIYRKTPYDELLVRFNNGANLTEAELNLATEQNFYINQETRDYYVAALEQALLNLANANGIIASDPDQAIQALVNAVLSNELALEIQQRITDIDLNGQTLLQIGTLTHHMQQVQNGSIATINNEKIIRANADEALASDITTLFAAIDTTGDGLADAMALIVTEQTVRAAADTAMALDITSLSAAVDANADGIADASAAVVTEAAARVSGDSANASSITALSTTVGGHTSTLTTLAASIDGIEAHYGVSLNVDGYITGFTQMNDGDTGTFAILADEFYIVDPSNDLDVPQAVFGVVDGVVYAQNMAIGGNLLVGGTITAAHFVFAGTDIEIPLNGHFSSGQTAFDTGDGWWLGTSSGDTFFSLGSSSGGKITYRSDTDILTIDADLRLPGAFVSSDTSGAEIVRNDSNATGGGAGGGTFATLHEFSVFGTGTIAVRISAFKIQTGASNDTVGQVRLVKNGSSVVGSAQNITASGGVEYSWTGITVGALTDTFQVQAHGGSSHDDAPIHIDYSDSATIDWTSVRAVWQLGEFF